MRPSAIGPPLRTFSGTRNPLPTMRRWRAAMPEPVLSARDLWKSYDGRADVLRGVSLDVGRDEAVLVWGPNGSGKTTLLSILGGLDVPTRGSVSITGREISRLRESELSKVRLHEIGFVFQTHNLIDDLTVEENVALPLRLAKRPADKRVADLLDAFALAQTSYHASIVLASHDPGVRAVPAATYRLESGILSREA